MTFGTANTKPNAAATKHVAVMGGCVRIPGNAIERQDPTEAGSFMG